MLCFVLDGKGFFGGLGGILLGEDGLGSQWGAFAAAVRHASFLEQLSDGDALVEGGTFVGAVADHLL